MQQVFQCYRCGAQNYMGQAYCWNCNEKFQYYCPWCNALVDPTLPSCPNCRATLPWQAQQHAGYPQSQDVYQYGEDAGKPAKRAPWIIALVCLALITVVTLAAVYLPGIFKQPDQSSPASQPQVSQPTPSAPAPTPPPASPLHTPAAAPVDNEF